MTGDTGSDAGGSSQPSQLPVSEASLTPLVNVAHKSRGELDTSVAVNIPLSGGASGANMVSGTLSRHSVPTALN